MTQTLNREVTQNFTSGDALPPGVPPAPYTNLAEVSQQISRLRTDPTTNQDELPHLVERQLQLARESAKNIVTARNPVDISVTSATTAITASSMPHLELAHTIATPGLGETRPGDYAQRRARLQQELSVAEQTLDQTINWSQERKAVAQQEAQTMKDEAAGEAEAIREPAEKHANEVAGQIRAQAEADKAAALQEAENIKHVAPQHVENIGRIIERNRPSAQAPYGNLSRNFLKTCAEYDVAADLAEAANDAAQIKEAAEAAYERAMAQADYAVVREMSGPNEDAAAIIQQAEQFAEQLLREVHEEVCAKVQAASRIVAGIRDALAGLDREEAEATARREQTNVRQATAIVEETAKHATPGDYSTAPLRLTLDVPPASTKVVSPQQPQSGRGAFVKSPPSRSTVRRTVSRPETPRRGRRGLVSSLVAAAGVAAVAVGVHAGGSGSNSQSSALERLAADDIRLPSWFPTAGSAWQEETERQLLRPDVGVGPNNQNFLLRDPELGGRPLGGLIPLTALLGSLDNPYNRQGVIPTDASDALAAAKQLNVDYKVGIDPNTDPKKAQQLAENQIAVAIKIGNGIILKLFSDPAKLADFQKNPGHLAAAFGQAWPVDDGHGQPAPPNDPHRQAFAQTFAAIGADMLTGAKTSDEMTKFLTLPANQPNHPEIKTIGDLAGSIAATLEQDGILSEAEKKAATTPAK